MEPNSKNDNNFINIVAILMVIIFGITLIKNIVQQEVTINSPVPSTTTTIITVTTSIPETTTTTKISTTNTKGTQLITPDTTQTILTQKNTTTTLLPSSILIPAKSFALAISSKYNHTCVLLDGNNVKCWGNNEEGQLGNGEKSDHPVHSAVSVIGLSDVVDITTGGWGTCALIQDGTIRCWGVVYPEGKMVDYYTHPVNLFSLQNVVSISQGYLHTCVLFKDGTVRCWGDNQYGQLGDGTNDNKTEPVEVKDLFEAKEIAAGYDHTCALLKDGTVKCWGDNTFGALGNGTTTSSNIPVLVSNLSNVKSISAGNGYNCVLLNNGTVKCWGRNYGGQLGDGTTNDKLTPVLVKGLENDEVIKITTGGFRTCALLKNKTVKCWGEGYTEKGITVDFAYKATLIPDLTNVEDVATGHQHTCVLLANKTVKCWGLNNNAQIGDGTFDYYVPLPRSVVGL